MLGWLDIIGLVGISPAPCGLSSIAAGMLEQHGAQSLPSDRKYGPRMMSYKWVRVKKVDMTSPERPVLR